MFLDLNRPFVFVSLWLTYCFVAQAYETYELGAKKGLFRSMYQRSLYNVDHLSPKPWWNPEETGNEDMLKVSTGQSESDTYFWTHRCLPVLCTREVILQWREPKTGLLCVQRKVRVSLHKWQMMLVIITDVGWKLADNPGRGISAAGRVRRFPSRGGESQRIWRLEAVHPLSARSEIRLPQTVKNEATIKWRSGPIVSRYI